MIVGQIEIAVEPTEVGKPAPRTGLGVVQALVFRAEFIVPADGAAQEKRRWEKIAQLHAVSLGFAADDTFQGQRSIHERVFMGMKLSQAAKVGEKPPAAHL